ncbi:MAG: DUF5320 domain-containing protein [Candidatus Altiarchaeota archaeon]|nr:DUF5320 domain-containing protein [Candidatus Altiarchaeota archaeon]
MPGGDGTGPWGTGGRCTPLWMSGQIERPIGFGFRGRAFGRPGMGGRGRGFRNMFYMTGQPGWIRSGVYGTQQDQAPSKEQEIEYLEQESRILSEQLEGIKERLARLGK